MLKDTLFEKESDFEMLEKDSQLVILADSIAVLKKIKSKTIDLIFADEPYNIGKDFGNNKDSWKTKEDYINWNKKWLIEAMRILKPNGTLYLMTATQHMPFIDVFMQENYHVVSRIVWSYDSSGVQSKKKYGSLYEPIIMVTKNERAKYTFNHEDILVEAKTGAKRGLIDYRKTPPQPYNTQKVPGNVWEFPRVRFKMEEYENHPTQKPEILLERIIKASSNIDDIVLDPFSGSFTTGAVAKKLKRKFIGIDMNPEYFEIGLRRLGIAVEYNEKQLIKEKKRKTRNTSKKDHINKVMTNSEQMELSI